MCLSRPLDVEFACSLTIEHKLTERRTGNPELKSLVKDLARESFAEEFVHEKMRF